MAAITPGNVLDWKQSLRRRGSSDQTIINSLSRLARFFDYAVAQGLHPGPNPARHEDIRRPVHPAGLTTPPLTLDQVKHVLRVAGDDTRSGARASALILVALAGADPRRLRWADCPTLPPAVIASLDRYAARTRVPRGDDAFVFVAWRAHAPWRDNDRHAPISRAQVSSTLARLGSRAGLPQAALSMRSLGATVRSLRHTPRGAALLDHFLQSHQAPP